MSNTYYVDVNKVENVKSGNFFYEIAMRDDYNRGSIDITEEEIPKTDIDTLRYCLDNRIDAYDGLCDVIDAILEYQSCVTINNTHYSWNEIKYLFSDEVE